MKTFIKAFFLLVALTLAGPLFAQTDFYGTSGDDVLDQKELGLEDWSNIYGLEGDDTITVYVGRAEGGAGNDKIIGKSNASYVMYGTSPRGVIVNLATGVAQDGFGTTDTITDIRVVAGSRFDDIIIGSLADEEFWGQGGSDTFVGGGGSDTVVYWDIKPTEVSIKYEAVTDTITVNKNNSRGNYGIDLLTGIGTITFRGPNNYRETLEGYDLTTDFPKVSSIKYSVSEGAFVSQFKGGDFNGDGISDVLVVEQYGTGIRPAKILVFLGDGNGAFLESTTAVFSTSASPVGLGQALVADFNKDGISDLFLVNGGNDAPPWAGGRNQLFLSSLTSLKLEDASSTLQQITQVNHGGSLGDVNGDGHLDVLINSLDKGNFLHINNGSGQFVDRSELLPHTMIATESNNLKRTNTISGIFDLNFDGHSDIVLGRWNGDFPTLQSQVLINDGKANFNKISPIDLPLSEVYREIILDIKAIDLNGDTFPDLMLAVTNGGDINPYNTPYIQLLINDGNGNFHDETKMRLPQDLSVNGGYFFELTNVDFNRDGHPDILAKQWGGLSSTIYLNRGDGTFSKYWESARGGLSIAMDVDNDGMLDIVTMVNSSSIFISQNNLPNSHVYKANFGGDALLGSSISDKFYNGQGNDILNGGAGIDLLINPGLRSTYQISRTNAGLTQRDIGAIYGTDTLKNIERIQFTDISLAFDLDGNAGTVAKILGAVAGRESLTNKEYVGIGLDLVDKGMSYSDLAALALQAVGLNTNDQIVTALWTNVIGSAPSAADKAPFIEMLENGFSRGELAKLAAETAENAANIGLVGLAETGIEYLPVD